MKIDIVHPAHYRADGTLVQSRGLRDRLDPYLPHLGPILLAALTPPRHEVRDVEEFYSLRSIARRVLDPAAPNRWINLGQNLVFRSKVRRGVHPVYFDA